MEHGFLTTVVPSCEMEGCASLGWRVCCSSAAGKGQGNRVIERCRSDFSSLLILTPLVSAAESKVPDLDQTMPAQGCCISP